MTLTRSSNTISSTKKERNFDKNQNRPLRNEAVFLCLYFFSGAVSRCPLYLFVTPICSLSTSVKTKRMPLPSGLVLSFSESTLLPDNLNFSPDFRSEFIHYRNIMYSGIRLNRHFMKRFGASFIHLIHIPEKFGIPL